MDYFKDLAELLQMEKEEDRRSFEQLTRGLPVAERRAAGISWYPVAIRDTETGRGDYLTVELERTTNKDILHQFRFGMAAALFSNHDPSQDRIEGTISYVGSDRMKISLRTDELPEWARNGKLGVDAVFDENSYAEMEATLKKAQALCEDKEGDLVRVLTGKNPATQNAVTPKLSVAQLNEKQREAVQLILCANDLAIVHGPPGTGKTTTLVSAIKALKESGYGQLLVTAPSNAAVDLLTEKLFLAGLDVVRVGNPARVSDRLMALTLDSRMAAHASMKEVKRLKKQASEYRDLAHKYKRSFGPSEREQRKALFTEARNISREVEKTEQYISDSILGRADVITSTLVGANHFTVRSRSYAAVCIDEAGQGLEPACWIPALKTQKLVLAGDHCQLPPTIKSEEAARKGLSLTLLEKCVALHPQAVVMLEEQYRMNEEIMGYSSEVFYKGLLQAAPSVAHHLLFPGDVPLVFVDTAGCGFEERREGVNLSNPEECAFLIRHLSRFVESLPERYGSGDLLSFAVISPYRHQVELLRTEAASNPVLSRYGESISVNTIDSFQGQERDVVYISLARSNADQAIGFLSEIRRMNVAMTRARKKLVVIGDSATLSQHPFYAGFIEYVQGRGGYQSAWEHMDL